jgi:hypothetical protein
MEVESEGKRGRAKIKNNNRCMNMIEVSYMYVWKCCDKIPCNSMYVNENNLQVNREDRLFLIDRNDLI